MPDKRTRAELLREVEALQSKLADRGGGNGSPSFAEETLLRERQAFRIIAEASLRAGNASDLCCRVLGGLLQALRFDIGSIRLYDEQNNTLELAAIVGLDAESVQNIPLSQSLDDPYYLAAYTAQTREPVFAPDVSVHPIARIRAARIGDLSARAVISWPILDAGQHILGIMQMVAHQPKPIADEDRVFFETVARMFAIALERSRAEERLRESEQRYRALAENSPTGIWQIDPDGATLYANPAMCVMLGVERPDEIGRKSENSFFTPESTERIEQELEKRREGKASTYEVELIRRDGERRMVMVSGTPVTSEDGTLNYAIASFVDITESKRTEKELGQRAAQLTLINQVAGRIAAVLDLDTLLEQAAHLTQEAFGYQHVGLFLLDRENEDLVMRARAGSYAARFSAGHRLKLGRGMVGWSAQNGEILLANDVRLEPRYVNPFSPEEIIRSELSVPIRVGGGIVGVLDVQSRETDAFDDTDVMVIETLADQLATAIQNASLYEQVQQHAEELEARVNARTAELQAAYEHLQALSRVRDEFVANVSHELRTPIANLKLYHHLLVEKPEKQGRYVEILERETERLENIVEDLLYLSRLDRDEAALDCTPVDINEFARIHIADRAGLALAKGLTLALVEADGLPAAPGNRALLERVLSSLLDNSLNYTPSGGRILVTTHVRETEGKHWAGFTVSNDGPGIPPDELPYVFDRFFRGRLAQEARVPGTGLGLAIAKTIVERHGGEIVVESGGEGPRQGVAFHVWLPIGEPEPPAPRPAETL